MSRVHNPVVRAIALLIAYACITAVYFHSFLPQLGSSLIGPPEDNMNDFWNSWYAVTGHARGPGFFFTTLMKYPEGTSLYYHSFAYPQLAMVWLGAKIFGTALPTLIIIHNLVLLSSFPIAGLGAFCLARHWGANFWAAVIAGFVFAFNPSHVEHSLHHLGVAAIGFLPFFVLGYLKALETCKTRWVALSIICYGLSALACWYYLFYCGYFIVFHTFYAGWLKRARPRGWHLRLPIIVTGSVCVLLLPLILPMLVQTFSGAPTTADGVDIFSADLLAYSSFPVRHLFSAFSLPFYNTFSGNIWEGTVYLGLVNIGLLIWLNHQRSVQNTALIKYLMAAMMVFALFASGSWLHISGLHVVPLPDLLLSNVPFFKNVRTPSRAIVMVYLFLSIIVGLALTRLMQQDGPWKPASQLLALLCSLLIMADFYPVTLEATPLRCNAGLSLIRDDGGQAGVLNLPTGYTTGDAAMTEQICHNHQIVEGITAREVSPSLRNHLETRDLVAQRAQLIANKVKYIVMRRKNSGIYSWLPKDGVRAHYTKTYPTLYADNELLILKVY